jgi:hypothetical protein
MKGRYAPTQRLPISPGNDAVGRRARNAAPNHPHRRSPDRISAAARAPPAQQEKPVAQATVSFPYNILLTYPTNSPSQDYQLAIDCPITPNQAQPPPVTVTPGSPSLIVEPGRVSGTGNAATITAGPVYQNNQIQFTVHAVVAAAQQGTVQSVIINLQVAVTYQFNNPTDGPTPTAAVSMFQGYFNNYLCTLNGSDGQNGAFYGHNLSVAGTTAYPSTSLFSATASLPVPVGLGKTPMGGLPGDVSITVNGSGNADCGTAYVSVTVNQSSQPKK